jgi:hypothetical protein
MMFKNSLTTFFIMGKTAVPVLILFISFFPVIQSYAQQKDTVDGRVITLTEVIVRSKTDIRVLWKGLRPIPVFIKPSVTFAYWNSLRSTTFGCSAKKEWRRPASTVRQFKSLITVAGTRKQSMRRQRRFL